MLAKRFLGACVLVFAAVHTSASFAVDDSILDGLKEARPSFEFGDMSKTPVDGFYEVEIINGPTIYLHESGDHFFVGDLFEVHPENGLVNLAEQKLESDRVAALESIGADEMISFGPENPKKYVYVFTDVDCYYCQKLHLEVPALTAIGIEVRYLAYPRAGFGSPSYRKIASAWCADDKQESLTKLKSGEEIEDNVCEGNPVQAQYELGGKLGVRGTPAIITATGKLLPGYMPAAKLAKEVGL